MSFPRYPEYKDSGVEWLGTIPSHWSVIPLAKIALGPGSLFIDGDWVESKDLADEGIRYITTGNVGEGRYKEQGSGYISQAKFDELRCTEVLPDDVLISRLNLPIGRACVVPDLGERIITSVDNVITRPDSGYSRSYLAYMLSSASHFANMEILARGTTMQRISRSTLGQVRFAFPTSEEQTAIANFLDRETAKIDALVAEQEKLIALLQEKRQAVISHAVTKGLDPNVPMKDSGVEWLGEVPGHWEANTLRRCVIAVQTGGTPSADALSDSLSEGFVWYTPGDFGSALKLSTSTRRITNEAVASGEAKVFPPNSVLIVSIGATLGKVGFAQDASSANQQINAVVPSTKIDGYFLAWSLSVKTELMRFLSNASTIGIMNQEKTKDIWIALPPIEEQMDISVFLDHETSKLDALTAEARAVISLLQERRTALISAAVTGQIDVLGIASRDVS